MVKRKRAQGGQSTKRRRQNSERISLSLTRKARKALSLSLSLSLSRARVRLLDERVFTLRRRLSRVLDRFHKRGKSVKTTFVSLFNNKQKTHTQGACVVVSRCGGSFARSYLLDERGPPPLIFFIFLLLFSPSFLAKWTTLCRARL